MNDQYFQKILQTMYSQDDYEYIDLDKREDVKECPLCHKMFYPEGRNGSRQRYCKRTHVVDCQVCGKPILQREASEKYGTVKFTCSKECASKLKIQKARDTMKEKYGYSNPSQIPEFKEKISASLKAKAFETTAKAKATLEERYGGMGTASPILREKIEATMRERYGVTNPSRNSEIRAKISEICKSPEYQAKYRATAIANWGVERPSTLEEVKQKMKQTSLERYGVECALQTEYAKQKVKDTCMRKYGIPNALQSDYARERARESFIANRHNHNNKISMKNQAVADYLANQFGITTEFEKYLGRNSYDLEIVGTNVLLEIDPTYTHSDLPNHWCDGIAPDYHIRRTEVAEEHGYRCIHIFDWDDLEKILLSLKNRSIIYARRCDLKEINENQASSFIDKYHIQGRVHGTLKAYGLYFQDELVQVMTFSRPRYNSKYEWELLRLCSKTGLEVVGGASRLFKAFIRDVNPQSIISYCDRAKFTGTVYYKMGMKLHHISAPAKVWSKDDRYITDNLLRQRGYDQLFNANYGKGTSNEELMVQNGWRSVYDCGQLVFEWRAK